MYMYACVCVCVCVCVYVCGVAPVIHTRPRTHTHMAYIRGRDCCTSHPRRHLTGPSTHKTRSGGRTCRQAPTTQSGMPANGKTCSRAGCEHVPRLMPQNMFCHPTNMFRDPTNMFRDPTNMFCDPTNMFRDPTLSHTTTTTTTITTTTTTDPIITTPTIT